MIHPLFVIKVFPNSDSSCESSHHPKPREAPRPYTLSLRERAGVRVESIVVTQN